MIVIGIGVTMDNKKRMAPDDRRSHILNVAVELSKNEGYRNITREQVAYLAGITQPLINRYFGSVAYLRLCVIRRAVDEEIPGIIAQYLAVDSGDSGEWFTISPELRQLAADHVRNNNAQNTERV